MRPSADYSVTLERLDRDKDQMKSSLQRVKDELEGKLQDYWQQLRDQIQIDISSIRASQSGTHDMLAKIKS